jgi:NADH-quinone oxidoreductase subunit I
VLDRFAIDYALCMYCGICVEVCPFDALFWSPEFEYSEYDIQSLIHEKDKLQEWTYTVLPPPELEEGAEPRGEAPTEEAQAAAAPTSVPPVPRPGAEEPPGPRAAGPQPQAAVEAPPKAQPPAEPAPAEQAEGTRAPGEEGAPARAGPPPAEVQPDQETYDRVLQEQLDKGASRKVAEGRAKAAAVRAARKKASEGGEG